MQAEAAPKRAPAAVYEHSPHTHNTQHNTPNTQRKNELLDVCATDQTGLGAPPHPPPNTHPDISRLSSQIVHSPSVGNKEQVTVQVEDDGVADSEACPTDQSQLVSHPVVE